MRWLFDEYCLDASRRELTHGGQPVRLEPQVFDLLEYLVRNHARLVTRDDLIASVWEGRIVSESALASRINAARAAIGDSGERQHLIKTIPRKGLRFVGAVREELDAGGNQGAPQAASLAPGKASVVVLPFSILSSDPEQDYFADGITEELTTALSRLRWFSVTARGSAFTYKGRVIDVRQIGRELGVRYVVEGSVRRAGGHVRVACRLADAESGHEVWADRFDGDLADIFGLQDRVAEAVAGAIEPSLRDAEMERVRRKPTGSLNAYDLYMRALPHFYGMTPDGIDRAQQFLQSAVALDPDFTLAEVMVAVCTMIRRSVEKDTPGEAEAAVRAARKAAVADPRDPAILSWAAFVLGYVAMDGEAAYAAVGRALAINPNSVEALVVAGYVCCWRCRPDEALGHLERAIRLSPFSPERVRMFNAVSLAHLIAGRHEAALEAAQKAVRERPDWWEGYRFVVLALAFLGRPEEAAAAARRLSEASPVGARVMAARTRQLFSDQTFAEARIRALREAGLPE
jgi:TolB-like protein